MIDLKTWGDFLFTFWKFIKKYHDNSKDNMDEAVKEADSIMKEIQQTAVQRNHLRIPGAEVV